MQVDGGELDRLSFGVVERGVEGVRADGGVEDGGLLAGRGGLVRTRFGQHRDRVLRRLNGGRLQQLARRSLGTLVLLLYHKLLLLLLLVLLNQRMRLNLSVGWNDNKRPTSSTYSEDTSLYIMLNISVDNLLTPPYYNYCGHRSLEINGKNGI